MLRSVCQRKLEAGVEPSQARGLATTNVGHNRAAAVDAPCETVFGGSAFVPLFPVIRCTGKRLR